LFQWTDGDTNFQIRVRDANDQLINGGRTYQFSLPASCGSNCSAAYTATSYTTSSGSASAVAQRLRVGVAVPLPVGLPVGLGVAVALGVGFAVRVGVVVVRWGALHRHVQHHRAVERRLRAG